MKTSYIIFIGIFLLRCSNNVEEVKSKGMKPKGKDEKIKESILIKFDLEKVDSLTLYSKNKGDSNYVRKSSFNNDILLKNSGWTGRPDSKERYLHLRDSFNIKKDYKFIFHLSNNDLIYTLTNLDIQYEEYVLDDGTKFYHTELYKAEINGIETNGNLIFR